MNLLKCNDVLEQFQVTFSNTYQLLQDLKEKSDLDLETEWQQAKKMWIDTCEEDTLGKQKMHNKEWISPETIE